MVFSEQLFPEYSAVANRACLCSPPSFCSWYEQVAQQFPPRHSRHFSKSLTPVRLVLSERQLQICPHKNGRQLRGTQQFCDEFISGKKRHFPRHVVILKFVKARVSREHCARPNQPEPSRSYQNDCLRGQNTVQRVSDLRHGQCQLGWDRQAVDPGPVRPGGHRVVRAANGADVFTRLRLPSVDGASLGITDSRWIHIVPTLKLNFHNAPYHPLRRYAQ